MRMRRCIQNPLGSSIHPISSRLEPRAPSRGDGGAAMDPLCWLAAVPRPRLLAGELLQTTRVPNENAPGGSLRAPSVGRAGTVPGTRPGGEPRKTSPTRWVRQRVSASASPVRRRGIDNLAKEGRAGLSRRQSVRGGGRRVFRARGARGRRARGRGPWSSTDDGNLVPGPVVGQWAGTRGDQELGNGRDRPLGRGRTRVKASRVGLR